MRGCVTLQRAAASDWVHPCPFTIDAVCSIISVWICGSNPWQLSLVRQHTHRHLERCSQPPRRRKRRRAHATLDLAEKRLRQSARAGELVLRHLPMLAEGAHRMHALGQRHGHRQRKAQSVVQLDRLLVLDRVFGVLDRLADTLPDGRGDEVEGRPERPY